MTSSFYVKFWGVRGTVPTPDTRMLRYGGHTSCVEVRCGNVVLVLDAGTGIINLGKQPIDHMHLLLSHTHIDHILGLCTMQKMFSPEFKADIWAGHLLPDMFINEALQRLISPPIFPVPLDALEAQLTFHDFTSGQNLNHHDFSSANIAITTMPLNHPDLATAYRIEYDGSAVCYITDVEHIRDNLDTQIVDFAQGCDIFIYDSTYDDRNFAPYEGWGHSTWQQAMRLGEAAKVGKIVMFHHDPSTTDDMLDIRADELSRDYSYPSYIAREGTTLYL